MLLTLYMSEVVPFLMNVHVTRATKLNTIAHIVYGKKITDYAGIYACIFYVASRCFVIVNPLTEKGTCIPVGGT